MGILSAFGLLGSGPTGPGSGFSIMPFSTAKLYILIYIHIHTSKYVKNPKDIRMMFLSQSLRAKVCSFRF